MLKVLYLPLNFDNPQTATVKAWQDLPGVVELEVFDYLQNYQIDKNKARVNREFIAAVAKFQPDLVHMQLQMTGIITPESIKTARSKVTKKCLFTNWSGDVRNYPAREILEIGPAVDFTFLSNTGQMSMYSAAGCPNLRYWQIGYDPELYYPLNKPSFDYELAFTGGNYPGTFADAGMRTQMLRELKKVFGRRFALRGNHFPKDMGAEDPLFNKDVNELYGKSRCILSISNFNDISHYFSDRLLICMASGRPVISYRFPDYQTYFSNNSDILIAHSVQEIVEKVRWCQGNLAAADTLGRAGAKKALSHHTYKSRIIELLQQLGLI